MDESVHERIAGTCRSEIAKGDGKGEGVFFFLQISKKETKSRKKRRKQEEGQEVVSQTALRC